MTEARRLRVGILLALGAGGALPALAGTGCGDVTVGPSGSASVGSTTATTTSAGSGGAGGSATATTTTTGSTTTSTTGAGGAPPLCPNGNPTQQCYTLAQLEQILNHPPMGGDNGDGGPDGGIVLTECPEHGLVQNDCCNPAAAGPVEQGDECCYQFCQSGCCGRAFVVGDRAVVAGTLCRADWIDAAQAGGEDALATLATLAALDALDTETRAALRAAWLRDAQMEHASIASFARFTLELLGLGAPADLVAEAQLASLDEIAHARLCFGLASRFGRSKEGPAPLDLAGALRAGGLADGVAAAVREGCIGESIAALVAREQLARAVDPEVVRALARIAADEERHATLAFRFVRWGIAAGGEAVRAAARRAFEEGMRVARGAQVARFGDVDATAWARFGRLDARAEREAMRAALDEVIGPCAAAVLGAG